LREEDSDGVTLSGKLGKMVVRMRIWKTLVVAFDNFAKAPNKKIGKNIFELNAVIERAPKSNSVQRTYSRDFYVQFLLPFQSSSCRLYKNS
jgi:hypothetical protein